MMVFALTGVANAQFTNFGIRVGGGFSTLTDDLTEKTPILGASVGLYTTYEFTTLRSFMGRIFYLQFGANFVRRGGKYEEVFVLGESLTSEHKGSLDAYYVQVPVLANFHFELPIRKNRGHFVRAFLGPAVSVGVMGKYSEIKVTPYQPSTEINYKIVNAPAFDYVKRIDAEIIAGIGYEYKNITLSFYVDHGFLSVKDERDALRTLEANGSANAGTGTGTGSGTSNTGNDILHAGSSLNAYMFSFGYRFPIGRSDPRAE